MRTDRLVSTIRLLPALALSLSLIGCAGQKTFDYHRDGEKNLTAYTDQSTKRWLSSRHLNIALHHEKPGQPCHWEYAGTILLDDSKQQASLPTGQRMLVQFNFIELNRLNAGGRHQASNKLLTARPGSQYEIVMAFDENATYYEVFEKDASSGKRRTLELADAAQCRQAAAR